MNLNEIRIGDVRDVCATMPAASVHCVVTSPPYFGLRQYDTEPAVWGGDPRHAHEWRDDIRPATTGGPSRKLAIKGVANFQETPAAPYRSCACGAWLGELGSEPSPDLYAAHIAEAFRAVRRVLRHDGTLWLVIGDSYAGGHGPSTNPGIYGGALRDRRERVGGQRWGGDGYRPKELLGIPWLVSDALRRDGWVRRAAITWGKRAGMPESVRDRPTQATETIFMFSRGPRYYYDADAYRTPLRSARDWPTWERRKASGEPPRRGDPGVAGYVSRFPGMGANNTGANLRTHWRDESDEARAVDILAWIARHAPDEYEATIAAYSEGMELPSDDWLLGPDPVRAAHFATYPREIPRRAIMLGTSERGVCAECGAPWRRVVERGDPVPSGHARGPNHAIIKERRDQHDDAYMTRPTRAIGWRPGCRCGVTETRPAIVFDPFMGSGQTAIAAESLGRSWMGADAKPEYAEMAETRIRAARASRSAAAVRAHRSTGAGTDEAPMLPGLDKEPTQQALPGVAG